VTAAKAGSGLAVVELDAGEYYIGGTLQTTDGAYAQVPIPRVLSTDKKVTLVIRPKQGVHAPAPPYYGTLNVGGLVFRSTLTGQAYSGTNGVPSIIGGPDYVHGSGTSLWSYMTLHLKGIRFRQAANPSLCCINAGLIERLVMEDLSADTLGKNTGDVHFGTQPTNPCGIFNIVPINNLDGCEYRGFFDICGHYAGPAIGELTTIAGTLLSYENYVALNLQTPWHHDANIKAIDYLNIIQASGVKKGALTVNGGANLDLRDLAATTFIARSKRNTTSLNLTATAWADVDTATDLVIDANPGDWIGVGLSAAYGNQAPTISMDAVSVIAGAPVNSWAVDGAAPTAAFTGIDAWGAAASAVNYAGGMMFRKVVAGDIDANGQVTLRLRYRASAATGKTLFATADDPLTFFAENRGRTGRL
jgi:hypothetical protein